MKQFNIPKGLLTLALAGAAYTAGAQTQPLKFATGANGKSNWYANYVGVQLDVVYPASVEGDKIFTTSNDGNSANTNNWGGYPTNPIINEQVAIPTDSMALQTSWVTGSMTGKVALIYRGGSYFGDKAYYAQMSGADACLIINNIPGGPVGMAVGGNGSSVTIPVYMISQSDGDALAILYDQGVTIPRVTITTWGQHLGNDLGFVPQGTSTFPAYAMPFNQLNNTNNPDAYKNVDGAFVANYGTKTETNTVLRSALTWTPTSGSASVVENDSAKLSTPFTSLDSIYTLYSTDAYDLHASSTGKFEVTYTLSSDSTDDYPGNNVDSNTMYVTDNIWSKGSFNFTTGTPQNSIWYGPSSATETWGPYFYVNKGGYSVDNILASYASSTTGLFAPGDQFTFYMFTWKDSVINDGIIEAGELQMVGFTTYSSNGTTDSSEGNMTIPMSFTDLTTNPPTVTPVITRDTTWYWVCGVLESGQYNGYLGCDGVLDMYPRSYGRYHQRINSTNPHDSTYVEPYGPIWGDDGANISSTTANTTYGNFPFDNIDIDSVTYSNQQGLIPNIAMQTSMFPASVKPVVANLPFSVSIYPNPAAEANVVNVNVTLDQAAKIVTYIVLDPLGRVVSKVSHYNVQNSDKLVIPTANLAAGGYYVSVIVDGKNGTKKFEIIK